MALNKFLFLFFLSLPGLLLSQTVPDIKKNGKDQWDKKEWRKANTARFAFYMGKQIRESVRLMNLARINGQKFSSIYIEPILDKTDYETSLIRTLQNQSEKQLLRPSVSLYASAAVHAFFSGVFGHKGHRGFNERMLIFQPFTSAKRAGENCDYGRKKALDITLSLLIDKGVASLGHRKNILSEDFARIGGSSSFHIQLRRNAVFNYSSANWKDLLLYVKPDIQQYGINIGLSQISDKPMLDLGLAYFVNHMETSDLLLTLNYQKGISGNKTNAVSLYLGSGSNTGLWNNFMLGAKLQTYFNTPENNLYIQPEVSWFAVINILRNGYLLQMNDYKKSALYRFSYGYNIRIIDSGSPDIYRHNFTIARFICIKSKVNKYH